MISNHSIANKMAVLVILFLALLVEISQSFQSNGQRRGPGRNTNRNNLQMKWVFSRGNQNPFGVPAGAGGGGQEVNNMGGEGEYYYSPNKPAKLKVPKEVNIFKGKSKTIGIFPYNDVLLPLGSEMLNVLEMRHRQLLTEVPEDGTFGLIYYSQEQHKLGLVGTLARIKDRKLLDDGRVVVMIEGVDRFYVERIIAEKPYIKAQVRVFQDYTEEKQEYLDAIENKIFDNVRLNLKFLKLLYPQKKYSLSTNLVRYRPPSLTSGIRSVRIMDEASELDRRSKFSFAVTEMLSIAAPTKLVLMQDHLIEKRFARSLRILERGCEFMKDEIKKKNLMTAEGLERLQRELLLDAADVDEIITPSSSWQPENFVNGQWVQRPTLF